MPSQLQIWAPAFLGFGGGIAAFSRELVTALQHRGHGLLLLGRDDRSGRLHGAPVRGTGGVGLAVRKYLFALLLLATALARRPRLIICTHLNFAPVALWAKRLWGARYVVVAHGIDVHDGLSRARRQALYQADAVWAVSRWTRGRVLSAGVPAARIDVLSNTVDDLRFALAPPDPALRARHAIGPGEKVLLTVARLDPNERYKGYDTVLRALPLLRRQLGPVRYLLVGTGADRARVEQLARQLDVIDRVTFCGFVADEALPDYYRMADAFVMPSHGEGFGIVFLEAMACGTPVVGGNQDGTCDALADGALGLLVDPTDHVALAERLTGLLQGNGPAHWFDPAALRAHCLSLHGRAAFGERVSAALARLDAGER